MAAPFSRSAAVYGLIYADKDYAREAAFVDRLIKSRRPGARSLLELGCGPGLHARTLGRLGWRVAGIDRSAAMLARADAPSLSRGDIRTARMGKRFDAVVSLFHVFSYLLTDRDLAAALKTAHHHLKPGGMLVFDCWHAPAVKANPPRPRRKTAEDALRRVLRLSMPALDWPRVEVLHRYRVEDKKTGQVARFDETHVMRCRGRRELEKALKKAGFTEIEGFEWLTERPLSPRTWSACFVAVKAHGAATKQPF